MGRSLLFIALLCAAIVPCRAGDSLSVYFPLGKAELDAGAIRSIDSMIKARVLKRGEPISIIGYCDYIGGKRKNDSLSYQRAENVMLYLIGKDFFLRDIELCIGKGKIEREGMDNKDGYQPDRKVAIVKKGPELPKTAKTKAPPKPEAKPETHQLAEMTKLKVNELVSLNAIYFEPGTHVLIPSSVPQLDSLYEILDDNPKIKVAIEGHICCLISSPGGMPRKISAKDPDGPDTRYDVNDADSDEPLSHARARSVSEFLINKGIDKKRITYKGLGTTHNEAAMENSPEQEQHDRRVDVRIMGK